MNRRGLPISALATSALLALTPTIHALPVAYDGFESDTSGTDLNGGTGGTGWPGSWTAAPDHVTVQTKTLVDPNGLVNGGTQATRFQPTTDLPDQGSFISRALPSMTGTLYMSLLIRHENGIGSDDFVNFQVSDGATGNNSSALGVGIRNAGGNPFFARVGSSGNATTNASTNAVENVTYLLVAKFSKDGSSNYNRTDLFINPTSTSEPITANASATFGGTGISQLTLFSVRNFQPEANDTIFFDELRFATTFEDALVPEPGSFALLGLGGLLVARRRRD